MEVKFSEIISFMDARHLIKIQRKLQFSLKACVRYFSSNFYFSPSDSPSKTMKNVFYFI